MIPIYGRKRCLEIKEYFDAGKPIPFAGGHYFIVSIEYDARTESGRFSVQQLMTVDKSESDTSVRDAVLDNMH